MTTAAQLRISGRPGAIARHRIVVGRRGRCGTCGRELRPVSFVTRHGFRIQFVRHIGPKS